MLPLEVLTEDWRKAPKRWLSSPATKLTPLPESQPDIGEPLARPGVLAPPPPTSAEKVKADPSILRTPNRTMAPEPLKLTPVPETPRPDAGDFSGLADVSDVSDFGPPSLGSSKSGLLSTPTKTTAPSGGKSSVVAAFAGLGALTYFLTK